MAVYTLVRTTLTVTQGDSGLVDAGGGLWYKEFTIAAVNMDTAQLTQSIAESRVPSLPEPDLTLEHRGAFVQLFSSTVLRLYWRGELQEDAEAGQEAISAYVEVFDLEELSITGIAAAVWAYVIETGFSALRMLRIIAAAVAGKSTGGATNLTARDLADTTNMIQGSADSSGNRTPTSYGG
jgi:hypothetical protein